MEIVIKSLMQDPLHCDAQFPKVSIYGPLSWHCHGAMPLLLFVFPFVARSCRNYRVETAVSRCVLAFGFSSELCVSSQRLAMVRACLALFTKHVHNLQSMASLPKHVT